jgi:hypothetical protein
MELLSFKEQEFAKDFSKNYETHNRTRTKPHYFQPAEIVPNS